ncbi:MAG: glutathione S-transferase family protein [Kofleriaceae bacterium]
MESATSLSLYYNPGSASLAPHLVLNELGLAHELVSIDQEAGEQKRARYLQLNPHGRIPTLVHGELVLYEAAAICMYLADLAPGVLAPPHGSSQRPLMLQWMCFLTNTLQPALMHFHYPEVVHSASPGRHALREYGERWAGELFLRLDRELATRRFLLGDTPSICDFFLLMLCRWARTFAQPPRALPHLGPAMSRLLDRNAVQLTLAREGVSSPYV